jgi:hypothetical protein
MRLHLVAEPFDHPDYILELKHDAFRAQHVEKDGKDLFDEICRKDLEGIVAKRKASLCGLLGPKWVRFVCHVN